MFLFQCCQQFRTGQGYQIRDKRKNKDQVSFHSSLNQIDEQVLNNSNNIIMKIKKSEFDEVYASYRGTTNKFQDIQFGPNEKSLGNLELVTSVKWNRISELYENQVLMGSRIQPKDIIQGKLGNCYLLSALAALAEHQEYITNLFYEQTANRHGIYKVQLKIEGTIQEYIIDDYIPTNQKSEPIFCHPFKNEIWVLLLQKAWAKAHGSYANIISGTSADVLQALTFAPTEIIAIKQGAQSENKIWKDIFQYSKLKYPTCCATDSREDVDWKDIKLSPAHTYTLISAVELEDVQGKNHKLIKIRNPWGYNSWEGQANQKDIKFWHQIVSSVQKKIFLASPPAGNDGIFFMTFHDFCKYFTQIHVCMFEPSANYLSEQFFCNKKNGSVYEVNILKEGKYNFTINQSSSQNKEEGYCRTTILLIQITQQKDKNVYSLVDGLLKYNDENTTLKVWLASGKYLVYGKLDATRNLHLMPQRSTISTYSKEWIQLKLSEQQKYKDLLKEVFLTHALQNKRNKYNNDLMWISWKLLFQQGGYAYIAMGNDSTSNKKFIINFDEDEFQKMNFTLKKPYKHQGNHQVIQVLPGEQKIILARVKNQMVKSLKFPPTLGIKMELIP